MRFEGFAASQECRGLAGCNAPPSVRPPAPIWVPELPLLWSRRLSASEEVPHAKKKTSPSAAQAAGLRYEAKAQAFLAASYGDCASLASAWFVYSDSRARRHYCQPDFVAFCGPLVVVVEVKARWTPSAWWQTRHLYEPVLTEAFQRPVQSVVLCASYDPAIPPPEEVNFLSALPQSAVSGFPIFLQRF